MSKSRESPDFRNLQPSGRRSCPLPLTPVLTASTLDAYCSYSNSLCLQQQPNAREGLRSHQRTPSDGFLVEDEPSWLDELLSEPETQVRRGTHRRSSSDSFAYSGNSSISMNAVVQDDNHQIIAGMLPGESQQLDSLNDMQHSSYNIDSSSLSSAMDRLVLPGSLSATKKPGASLSDIVESHVKEEYHQGAVGSDKTEGSQAKPTEMDMDPKKAKWQGAQRSRACKLQYIAELERNVQSLQAEGLEFSAQLHFLDQQNLLLRLENKTLKQQLDCLVNEHVLKFFEHEMLGQEISRLRALYHHQQQQQWPRSSHRRSRTTDTDSQLFNLSLNGNGLGQGQGQVHFTIEATKTSSAASPWSEGLFFGDQTAFWYFSDVNNF